MRKSLLIAEIFILQKLFHPIAFGQCFPLGTDGGKIRAGTQDLVSLDDSRGLWYATYFLSTLQIQRL